MTSDSIPFLEVNALSNKVFLAINRIRYSSKQRGDTNSIFKEINSLIILNSNTKLIIDEKIINEINRNNNSDKVNTKSIYEKDQSFPKCFSTGINSNFH